MESESSEQWIELASIDINRWSLSGTQWRRGSQRWLWWSPVMVTVISSKISEHFMWAQLSLLERSLRWASPSVWGVCKHCLTLSIISAQSRAQVNLQSNFPRIYSNQFNDSIDVKFVFPLLLISLWFSFTTHKSLFDRKKRLVYSLAIGVTIAYLGLSSSPSLAIR